LHRWREWGFLPLFAGEPRHHALSIYAAKHPAERLFSLNLVTFRQIVTW